MSVLSDNYKRIISEIENKVSNPEECEFVKEKVNELTMLFMDVIDKLTNVADAKIKEIEDKQTEIENKMNRVQSAVDEIENDIYSEEEGFDFEIVCPYCNHEFVAEVNAGEEMKKEIECPDCHNIIELDWNEEDEDDGCTGHCGGCHSCEETDEEEEIEDSSDENEDDM